MATQDGIDAIRRLAVQFKGIMDLADELEKVNSIEQSADEARTRLNSIGREIEVSTAALAALKAGIADVTAEGEQIKAQAVQYAEKVKAQAEADAQSVKDEAAAVATATLSDASRQADSVIREAQASAKAAKDAAEAAQVRLDAADKAVDDKSVELKELLRKLEAAKARAAELLR